MVNEFNDSSVDTIFISCNLDDGARTERDVTILGMISKVLKDSSADYILTGGLVGQIFMLADGLKLGNHSETLIKNKGYEKFIENAKEYLGAHRDKIIYPKDIVCEKNDERHEIPLEDLPLDGIIFDIGEKTVELYKDIIAKAHTIFVNGPVGIYEEEISSKSTRSLWQAIENAPGFTVIGGGDTVTSFTKFTDIKKINYVSTAGGALIRYLSGIELPLLKAMKKNAEKYPLTL